MSESKGLIVVVEDEKSISDLLRMYLSREGFGVHIEADGAAGLAAIKSLRPVAVILDVGLPTMDGTQVCRELRAAGDWTPILFCTARDEEVDRILGLEMGGDDYITKPFSPREVVARIKSVMRRTSGLPEGVGTVRLAGIELDPETRRVSFHGEDMDLSAKEFDLLAHLMSKPSRVFTREELLSHVWGYSSIVGTRTVDVHVAQLRAKFGDDNPIRTVRGVGYCVDKD